MSRSSWIVVGFAVLVFGSAACGGGAPKDRPSDCRDDEFYNDRTKRCASCPAISPPDCARGCDYVIEEDDRGCPTARCAEGCRQCPAGSRYSTASGLCEACQSAPDCAALTCDGPLRLEEQAGRPCPPTEAYACGECLHPEQGCAADESGACVDRED